MVARVERVLQRLDEIAAPEQMALPGYRLHPLSGDLKGFWSVTVNGNWRVIFRFEDGQPRSVDLIDTKEFGNADVFPTSPRNGDPP